MKSPALILGLCLFFGLASLGFFLGNAAVRVKEYERSVTAKGLSERELEADIVIWPIQFTEAHNDLPALYSAIESTTAKIETFLEDRGVEAEEISISPPAITDRSAQQYGSGGAAPFRYTAKQTVTVYSDSVGTVREIMGSLSELGKDGIVFSGADYGSQPEFLFTRLNEIKPAMIEEATRNAREVAQTFAEDSQSRLGKIRRASQGQFSITPRDKNNPHIKKIRVVSTVVYYLSD